MIAPRLELRHGGLLLATVPVQRPAGACPLGAHRSVLPAGTVFMATTGVDTASGAELAPVATLGKAFERCPAGGTIAARGGTYSGQTAGARGGKRVDIVNYPGEPVTFDGLGSTPQLIRLTAGTAGSSFRGMHVRRYATTTGWPARGAVLLVHGGHVEHCHFTEMLQDGLGIMGNEQGTVSSVRHTTCAHNGQTGFRWDGNKRDGFTGHHLTAEYNWLHHNCQSPGMEFMEAGTKIGWCQRIDFLHNLVEDNLWRGVWFDVQCRDILMAGNWSRRNGMWGAYVEISGDAYVVNNVLEGNDIGLYTSSSHRVYVVHNVIARNRMAVRVNDGNRVDGDAGQFVHPEDVHVLNNLMLDGKTHLSQTMFHYWNPWQQPDLSNEVTLDGNLYWRSSETGDPSPKHISRWDRPEGGSDWYVTWAQHQAAGHDLNGAYATGPMPTTFGVGVPIPQAVVDRAGITAGPHPRGLLAPLAIY